MAAPDPPFAGLVSPPRRCCKCFYVLEHLPNVGLCPECGEPYDLNVHYLHTTKPPFVWWTFWMPGLITAVIFGSLAYAGMIWLFGYTWSSVIAVPAAAGVLLGYRVQVGIFPRIALVLISVAGMITALMAGNILGVLCGLTMGAVALLPVALGALVGSALRYELKKRRFSMRDYLPIVLAGFLLTLGTIEGRHPHLAMVSTSTLAVINATPEETWKAIQFYEQVKHRPPLLLLLTPCLRPAHTTGHSEKVGDIKICVYERGRLTKQITEVIPGKRLAFRVIEQKEIETDGVRLVDGSFDLIPSADGESTTVKLTTRYEPLLAPRFAFKWSEDMTVHTLHGHVLLGMREDAERSSTRRPQ